MRFLALGDSYTIGEGVTPAERWPVQLAALLRAKGVALDEPEIVARTGWTADELKAGIAAAGPRGPFDLVTLLIGVNDQYRGHPVEGFRPSFRALLAQAVGFAGGDAHRVLVVSIPDWGATPFAAGRDRARVAREIDAFNAVSREEAARAGIRTLDVTGSTRAHPEEHVDDGLHPSGRQYRRWADAALPLARSALSGARE
ncbi:MAG TPA: SGNH/GDSL hydrolase family protein [Thermoanaerobaculia bacterium]|nr:SGNH/GDSL hydrolase family protein [Thermoanaerobaculia bacterium]